MNSKREKKHRRLRLVPFLTVMFFISLTIYGVVTLLMPNPDIEPYYKYYSDYRSEKINVMLEDRLLDDFYGVIEVDETLYLSYEFVTDFLDEYAYWDDAEQTLIITTPQTVLKFFANETGYYRNRDELTMSSPVIIKETVYIPYELVEELYPFTMQYQRESNIAVLEWTTLPHTTTTVIKKQSPVRFTPSIKSAQVCKLDIGDTVMVYDNPDLSYDTDKWMYVKTESGYIGYMLRKHLASEHQTNPAKEVYDDTVPPSFVSPNGKINLVFDQMFNYEANSDEWRRETHNGLDVVSPAWFSVISADGEIGSIADHSYVDWAHSNNYQVWALLDNSFDSQMSGEFLSSTATRQKIIDSMIDYSITYGLDGINIDFENINQRDGVNYVQFVKEAAVYFRQAGLVSSVDVLVPMPHSAHYNREELGRFCDYVLIMAYDEHWSTSPVAGSVASIGWVETAVVNTLKSVPAEKIILGIPYYTFLWTTQQQNDKPSTKAYGMANAYALIESMDAELIWDAEAGQYYASFETDSAFNEIWLEDERSIELKVQLVDMYDLAGVAGWKRGLEKEEIWDLLYKYLKE